MWIKPESTVGNQILYNEGATLNGLGIRITDGTLEAGVANDGNLATVTSSFDRTDWTHVAVVFDTGELRLYVNGSEVAANSDVGYESAGRRYWGGEIGTAEHGFNPWEVDDNFGNFGSHVDATAIYNSALSADHISDISSI